MYQIDMSILRGTQSAAFKTAGATRLATSGKPMRIQKNAKTRPFPKLSDLKPKAAL